ncbi:transporter [Aquimonas sp.]|jgi:hypothetical protein|uniref:transporter n=1 Tax=Aquimonas sp. TaxID=1872588 RepID=UPI0037C16F80
MAPTPKLCGVLALAACAAVSISPPAVAQTVEPLATDRPDFVESSRTVGAGRWQVETSIAFERDSESGVRAEAFATPTLLRIGLSERWEARFETDGWIDARLRAGGSRADTSGVADLAIGLKHALAEPAGAGPAQAWLLHFDLPSGDRDFRGEGVRPSLRWVGEWALSEAWSLGVMPGVILDDDGEDDYVAGIFGIVVGRAWSPSFRSFAELALPQIVSTEHGGTEAYLDLGSAWLLSPDLQLDSAISLGLNDRSVDAAITVGLSARWR